MTMFDPGAMALPADPSGEPDAERPPLWTAEHVGHRLVDAMRTLDRLPKVKGPKPAGNHWVRHRIEWADHLAQAELPEAERRERQARHNDLALRPSGTDIDRMEAALDWLRELREIDAGLALVTSLWALRTARRRSVRSLCREKGWAPATLYKLRGRALDHLAAALNGRGAPVF